MSERKERYLSDQRDGYRFQRAVPLDLVEVVGLRVWSRYLGQGNRADAVEKARAHAHETDKLKCALRQLTPGERADLVSKGGWHRVEGGGGARSLFVTLEAELDADKVEETARHNGDAVQALAALRMRDEAKELRDDLERRATLRAKVTGTLDAGDAWQAAYDTWQRSIRSQTVKDRMRRYLGKFLAHSGAKRPTDVTDTMARAWRNTVEGEDVGLDTQRQHVKFLHSLMSCAISEGLARHPNAFAGLKVRPKTPIPFATLKQSKRETFSRDEMRTMLVKAAAFGAPSPVRRRGHPGKGRDDFGLAFKLVALHGARENEIAPLRADDVVTIDGITCIRLHDIAEDGARRSIKNVGSVRDVPLCKAVVKEVVALAQKRAGSYLFPRYGKSLNPGNKLSRDGHTFVRKVCGITDPRKPFYSVRHNFISALEALGPPPAIGFGIVGHEWKVGSHAGYTHAKVADMKRWIDRVKVD